MDADVSTGLGGGRPDPDADVKPDSLGQISKQSWRYVARRTLRGFLHDECPDLAAGLTYYAVLAVLPALIALISLLGVLGQGPRSVATILDILGGVVPASGLDTVRPVLERLSQSPAASLGLVLGVLGALWFVSGYVSAFGRAMNRIYAIQEGRPIWKLQPLMLLMTIVLGVLSLCAVFLVVISRPLARAIGDVFGFGSTVVTVWGIVKWPVLVGIVVVVIAMLYYFTPNVRQPSFRWLSPGAAVAIVTGFAGSTLFGVYVANFSNFDATYGSLAGAIVVLVWLWLTNTALLLGAELNAEVERARELQGGLSRAEHAVQLPPRDTRASDKAAAQHARDLAAGRRIREDHADTDYSGDGRGDAGGCG